MKTAMRIFIHFALKISKIMNAEFILFVTRAQFKQKLKIYIVFTL
jgi:hypothetical protein